MDDAYTSAVPPDPLGPACSSRADPGRPVRPSPVRRPDAQPIVKFRGVVKRLGGTQALSHVDLDLNRGEIHALLGANGAGKSTLIKLLAGIYSPDAGTITIAGRPFAEAAEHCKLAFIHQDLGLFDWMTVSENIALTAGYARRFGLITWRAVDKAAEVALSALGSSLSPQSRLATLSQADKSIVAISRALAIRADIVVLDEPTASLPEEDVARLFRALRHLRSQGVAILYVTHRLDEVFRLADQVTVLRDGMVISTEAAARTDAERLVIDIVGRPPSDIFVQARGRLADPILRVEGLQARGVGPVSFELRGGELLGLCGLRSAGQDTIGRAISGAEPIESGTISLGSSAFRPKDPKSAISHGIAFVSSKRAEEGMAADLTVAENIFLNPQLLGRSPLHPGGRKSELLKARDVMSEFSVTPREPEREIATLSGGNQQKAILARSFELGVPILVLEEPTQGVDVGAKADIYAIMRGALTAEKAMILVSSDFEEVAGVCNRALIFSRNKVVAEVAEDHLDQARLISLVGGGES
jgi:ribose transport system ATP-binding protein